MKIGLALSGGAALGAVHLGVLKAIDELNIKIDIIAGTSIGSLIGSFYAFGKDPNYTEKLISSLTWRDISTFKLSKLGLLSNTKINNFIDSHLGDVKFDESLIPLEIIATDISNGDKVILKEGDVGDAIMASMSLPGLYEPVEIENRLLSDGGIVENLPLSPLVDKVDKIIAVNLWLRNIKNKPNNILDIILNSFQFKLLQSKNQNLDKVDIYIEPDLSGFNFVDTKQSDKLIEKGYNESIQKLKQISI